MRELKGACKASRGFGESRRWRKSAKAFLGLQLISPIEKSRLRDTQSLILLRHRLRWKATDHSQRPNRSTITNIRARSHPGAYQQRYFAITASSQEFARFEDDWYWLILAKLIWYHKVQALEPAAKAWRNVDTGLEVSDCVEQSSTSWKIYGNYMKQELYIS